MKMQSSLQPGKTYSALAPTLALALVTCLSSCATKMNERDRSALGQLSPRWIQVASSPPTYIPATIAQEESLTVANSERISAMGNAARWIIPHSGFQAHERNSLKREAIQTALELRTPAEVRDAKIDTVTHVAGSVAVAPVALTLVGTDQFIKALWAGNMDLYYRRAAIARENAPWPWL